MKRYDLDVPSIIYLFESGDDIVWCDDPAPAPNMEPDETIKYIKHEDHLEDNKDKINQIDALSVWNIDCEELISKEAVLAILNATVSEDK